MKFQSGQLVTAVILGILSLTPALQAGTLFVSGDSNIANGLDNAHGAPFPNDNGTFFLNVLGGGTSVKVLSTTTTFITGLDSEVNTFYASQAGVSSSLFSGTITSAGLAGVNLLVILAPDHSFTGAELTDMGSFLGGGGEIFFAGENNGTAGFLAGNAAINAALSSLGSGMGIVNNSLDGGFHTTGPGQVLSSSFTSGVSQFTYAFGSNVTGGTGLFLYTDLTNQIIAFETTSTSGVPEPTTWVLLAAPLAAMLWFRRRA